MPNVLCMLTSDARCQGTMIGTSPLLLHAARCRRALACGHCEDVAASNGAAQSGTRESMQHLPAAGGCMSVRYMSRCHLTLCTIVSRPCHLKPFLQGQHSGPGVPAALEQLRSAVAGSLQAPPALAAELATKASDAGLPGAAGWADTSGSEWAAVWTAICQVPTCTTSNASKAAPAHGSAGTPAISNAAWQTPRTAELGGATNSCPPAVVARNSADCMI